MVQGEAPGARDLAQTPTWAVASVVAAMIFISIVLEKFIHKTGQFFQRKHNTALFEALEKVKTELMILGFISLTLTFSQSYIPSLCIPLKYANTMLPCAPKDRGAKEVPRSAEHRRRLLWYEHRILAEGGGAKGCKDEFCRMLYLFLLNLIHSEKGHVPLISVSGLHQLHIFIFFLAVFHVIYSAITMMLGKLKIRGWKDWERQIWREQEAMNDPARFRLTHDTSFVRKHMSSWNKTRVLFYMVCFFRQFFRSVGKADYLTMRHGFISVHLTATSKFDFQKYIKRSLEDDFKVVVGISPLLWASVVFNLLSNVHGWKATMYVVSFIPLFIILAIGTKLQGIITQMALEIQERHAVVQGIPLVQVSDKNFWFSWPELVLYLIHFVLFQNAFELTYFLWTWYEFGLNSCYNEDFYLIVFRVAFGLGAQFLCSYATLPLYALVTQMGSTMKRSIFDDQTSKALKKWRRDAGKKKNDGKPDVLPSRTLGGSPPDGSPLHPRPMKLATHDLEAEAPAHQHTANIMATVDLNSDHQQHHLNDNDDPFGQRDLLSG